MINELLYSQTHSSQEKYYLVKPGDTIWKIARDFTGKGANYVQLEDSNPHIKDITRVRAGQYLIIPPYWEKMKKIYNSDAFLNPNKFAYDVTDVLLNQWIDYNRFNSYEALRVMYEKKRILTKEEVIDELQRSSSGLTALAIYWVLLCRFESVFDFSIQETKYYSFLKVGEKYFDIVNTKGKVAPVGYNGIKGQQSHVDKKFQFNKIVDKHINASNLEDARKLAGFHNKYSILQMPAIERLFNF